MHKHSGFSVVGIVLIVVAVIALSLGWVFWQSSMRAEKPKEQASVAEPPKSTPTVVESGRITIDDWEVSVKIPDDNTIYWVTSSPSNDPKMERKDIHANTVTEEAKRLECADDVVASIVRVKGAPLDVPNMHVTYPLSSDTHYYYMPRSQAACVEETRENSDETKSNKRINTLMMDASRRITDRFMMLGGK